MIFPVYRPNNQMFHFQKLLLSFVPITSVSFWPTVQNVKPLTMKGCFWTCPL